MKKNVIREKSFEFALSIVELYKSLTSDKKEFVLSKQLLRSGTSIGAMIRESEHAESKADFIHKFSVAQKEANESEYWIELLYRSAFIDVKKYNTLIADISEIRKILAAIILSSKSKKQR